ncbi:unnamed protein product, partial [Mesorhabditis belari]|uniref:Uncharacterized protein n=1 Tax=Mesorhabditis belari TaxID=2138241 RepID=A0AAF3EMC0_9BILA
MNGRTRSGDTTPTFGVKDVVDQSDQRDQIRGQSEMITISQRTKGLIYDDEMFKYKKDKGLKSEKVSYMCTKAGCEGRAH